MTLLFTGMVLAIQTAYSLAAYGGKPFVGDIIALSVVRELGPVLTALMVAGRVGAGITAELGSMAVTEQVDAMRALAADPIKKLVVPRVGALTLVLPMLSVLSIAIALFGGMLMAILEIGQSRAFFVSHATGALTIGDVFSGIGKTFFFAIFIGIIACYNGITATGGTEGAGRDELHRCRTDEHAMLRSPDLAHAAAADLLFEGVLPDRGGGLYLLAQAIDGAGGDRGERHRDAEPEQRVHADQRIEKRQRKTGDGSRLVEHDGHDEQRGGRDPRELLAVGLVHLPAVEERLLDRLAVGALETVERVDRAGETVEG